MSQADPAPALPLLLPAQPAPQTEPSAPPTAAAPSAPVPAAPAPAVKQVDATAPKSAGVPEPAAPAPMSRAAVRPTPTAAPIPVRRGWQDRDPAYEPEPPKRSTLWVALMVPCAFVVGVVVGAIGGPQRESVVAWFSRSVDEKPKVKAITVRPTPKVVQSSGVTPSRGN